MPKSWWPHRGQFGGRGRWQGFYIAPTIKLRVRQTGVGVFWHPPMFPNPWITCD